MFSAAENKDFCVADCRYWPWPILCISLVHPGGKRYCSLKNNRQTWECAEMKGKRQGMSGNDFLSKLLFFLRIHFSETMSPIDHSSFGSFFLLSLFVSNIK